MSEGNERHLLKNIVQRTTGKIHFSQHPERVDIAGFLIKILSLNFQEN